MTGPDFSATRRLRRAFGPFFGRFGGLTPIQAQAIPRILDGANVVVASPTASGKTESVHLLSATLSAPEEVAARYVADFEVVAVPGQRGIEYSVAGSLQEAGQLARRNRWHKLLCFCNSRAMVEEVAAELAELWKPYPVVAHHGSLDRRLREEAEQVMQQNAIAACVATSTLEIGIDIGDLDLIVLAEPPWSLSSLLQRVSRGNRRSGLARAAAIARSEAEQGLIRAMFETAATGALPVQPYRPDPSVAVQQTCSYLYQHPSGVGEAELVNLLSPLCSEADGVSILGHLQQEGWIEQHAGYWQASTRVMNLGERGLIHSNIPDTQAYRVIDVTSGRQVGTVAGAFDRVFALGRRSWRVLSVAEDLIRAVPFQGPASPAVFRPHRNVGAFAHLLPPYLRQVAEYP